MGDYMQTLRETGLKAQAMSVHGGEFSEAENVKMFKASDLCRDLRVGGATVRWGGAWPAALHHDLFIFSPITKSRIGFKMAKKKDKRQNT
jgi:hypothetical protein